MSLPDHHDIRAARVLLKITQIQLAKAAGVDPKTIENLEAGRSVRGFTVAEVARLLASNGIIFDSQGRVRHEDGRRAPTTTLVGELTGARLQAGLKAIDMYPAHFAMKHKLTRARVRQIAALERPLERGAAEDQVFAVFNAIEAEGYQFGKSAAGDRLR